MLLLIVVIILCVVVVVVHSFTSTSGTSPSIRRRSWFTPIIASGKLNHGSSSGTSSSGSSSSVQLKNSGSNNNIFVDSYKDVLVLISDYFDIVHNPSILDNTNNDLWDTSSGQLKEVVNNDLIVSNTNDINKCYQLLGESSNNDINDNTIQSIEFISSGIASIVLLYNKDGHRYTDMLSVIKQNNDSKYKIIQCLRSSSSSLSSPSSPSSSSSSSDNDSIDTHSELLNLASVYMYANHVSDPDLISKIFHPSGMSSSSSLLSPSSLSSSSLLSPSSSLSPSSLSSLLLLLLFASKSI